MARNERARTAAVRAALVALVLTFNLALMLLPAVVGVLALAGVLG